MTTLSLQFGREILDVFSIFHLLATTPPRQKSRRKKRRRKERKNESSLAHRVFSVQMDMGSETTSPKSAKWLTWALRGVPLGPYPPQGLILDAPGDHFGPKSDHF